MAQAPKYAQVMSVLERRVREGDYLLRHIPGERRIAEETGVSYMTARRAVIELLNKKVLIRRSNGSLDVHPSYSKSNVHSKIVLLHPAYSSPYFAQLRTIVTAALKNRGFTLRPVHYVHWDDPIVVDAISNEDGVLVIPSADSIPAWILAAIRENKAVVLDGDFSEEGIPSIRLFPDNHIEQVLRHLLELGHRRIDCVNTQPHTPEMARRIAIWKSWLAENDCAGRLWDNPAPTCNDPTRHAYEMIARLIDDRRSEATAIVCTAFPAALAATRVLWERGRQVGQEISVCSINIEYPARYCCPSITGLDLPDLSDVLAQCLDWFASDDSWRGKARLEPDTPTFFDGESSGPINAARQIS